MSRKLLGDPKRDVVKSGGNRKLQETRGSGRHLSKLVDHYSVLGVRPDSDAVVIRAAFRALMLKFHPDTNGSPSATEQAARINAAFAILGDPEKRQRYDTERRNAQKSTSSGERERSTPAAPQQPPPPPPKPPSQNGKGSTKPSGFFIAPYAIGIFLILLVLLFSNSGTRTADVRSVNATDMNMIATETAPAGTISAGDMTASLNDTMTDADVMSSIDLSSSAQTITALKFEEIEGAATDFDRVLQRRGISGARAVSQECHRRLQLVPSWTLADRCVAFDLAAAHVDEMISKAGDWPTNNYFAFKRDQVTESYAALNPPSVVLTVRPRVDAIRTSVEAVATQLIAQRISTERRKANSASGPGARTTPGTEPDGEVTDDNLNTSGQL